MLGRSSAGIRIEVLLLAAIVAASGQTAVAIDGLVPDNTLRASWSPSRDEAVVVENLPGKTSEASVATEGSVLNHSLLARRPASLSRPAPTRLRAAYTQKSAPTEALPTPAPASPEGLPVPSVMHSHDGQAFLHEGGFHSGGACCDPCAPNCCGQWNNCGPVSPCCLLPPLAWDNFEIFGGVHGFTGPLNRGGSGSFGFHEGFNWGLPVCGCLAWQWGVNWTQNTNEGSFVSEDERNQIFLTAGFFRRVDWGLQGGLVVDYLHEQSDYEIDLVQLRGELSWLFCGTEDIGVWFSAGVNDEEPLPIRRPVFGSTSVTFTNTSIGVDVNDLFAIFYRRQLACGGNARVFGGFTGSDQGLVGAEILLPINPCLSLRSNFLYVVPNSESSSESSDFVEETWNVGISLVWTRCPRSLCGPNYCRPLFNVADNGSFATRFPHQND